MAPQRTAVSQRTWLDLPFEELGLKGTKIHIEKALVYKKSRTWEIVLNATQYIPFQTIAMLQSKLRDQFFDIDHIKLRVTYRMSLESIIQNFEFIWEDLQECIKIDMPSVTWLKSCPWYWDGNVLHICARQSAKMDIATHKSVPRWIENWFQTNFFQKLKVVLLQKLEDDGAVSDEYFLEREREELELIRQATENTVLTDRENGKKVSAKTGTVLLGRPIKGEPLSIDTLREDSGRVIIEGCIFDTDSRELRGGKYLITIDVTDHTSSITVKMFLEPDKAKVLTGCLKKGNWFRFRGDCQYDKYQKEIVLIANDINTAQSRTRMDEAPVKRVELHLHTQMSSLDAVTSAKALIERAALWGHSAIAITDHGVVQAYPEAYAAGKRNGVKILFGVEAYLINDCRPIIQYSRNYDFDQTFVALDIETTGLDAVNNEIIEIGAVKIQGRKITDRFQSFVAPVRSIPAHITELTGITQDMVKDAPPIEQVLTNFFAFCGDAALVAHNASFDIGFLRGKARPLGIALNHPIVDTLALSRELLPELKRFKLNLVADHLGIQLKNHHRAADDAEVAGRIMLNLFEKLEEQGTSNLDDINGLFRKRRNLNGLRSHHAVLFVKNAVGLKNLYKLISLSHLEYYYRRPRIPKSLLAQYREGLIIGSGCEAGELYQAVLQNLPDEEINEIVDFYDYLEIQPIDNNRHLIRNGQVVDDEALREINRRIVSLGRTHSKRVAATGDVHFMDPADEIFRRILMSGQKFEDADHQAPLYFKTTQEMLEEFSYLGQESATEVVINAPRSIADEMEDIQPIPGNLFPPEIPGAEDEIRTMAQETAQSIYGNPLPDTVEKRLDKELRSIIGNGYAVLYLIAHKLVKKSNSDGYLVGSRGSVGSSFVATMTGITEVNPLPPHYICPACKNSNFQVDSERYGCGADLPDQLCPNCGHSYEKDGFDIPFEVFLGFKGDKVPDIDLNFSGEYQPMAHKYTEELFGKGYVFRAGTIGTIAEKTAFGFVKKYLEDKEKVVTNAEIKRLVTGCSGVKRTTGQHPGGILVVPKSREIYEFTPVQHPADDKSSGVITSHFDFHAIHDTLVKLDILGHDDPTVIRMLEDITGIDARTIPLGEEVTMKLFSGTESLQLSPEDINSPVGTFGVPEFGTKFVRQMLVDTKPTTFAELIRISGLSHGTDVWLNNAQELIRSNTATLPEVICTRDDIMIYLINRGLEPTLAFKIMENVRKGKGLTPEMEEAMQKKSVPEWYIDSCKKIKYMFPKAHAAAYVIMAFRIAWFKVYYPEAFYAAYFTVRADDFDAALILKGPEFVRDTIREMEERANDLTAKEKNVQTILEVALEMYMRGIRFVPINLYESHSHRFLITDEGIRPPLNALQGVGINAAKSIVEARTQGEFISIEDLRERAKVTKTVIEALQQEGVLKNLPETSQISLFSLAFPSI
ncbi:MAG: PolC-type DNA polymerase III [Caldicoprobacterales bacterium]|jgi:DNA polymerase-3 subunit alpha (Gram-positive type)|nr:PolC-type DNA polymerase III [Clostridiales bacterium]